MWALENARNLIRAAGFPSNRRKVPQTPTSARVFEFEKKKETETMGSLFASPVPAMDLATGLLFLLNFSFFLLIAAVLTKHLQSSLKRKIEKYIKKVASVYLRTPVPLYRARGRGKGASPPIQFIRRRVGTARGVRPGQPELTPCILPTRVCLPPVIFMHFLQIFS